MQLQTPETRGRRVRIEPRYPYGGPPEDFFGPGWAVEYPTSGQEHEHFRDAAAPLAINRQAFEHEAAWAAQRIGGE